MIKPTLLYCAQHRPDAADVRHTEAVVHCLNLYFNVVVLSGDGPPGIRTNPDEIDFRRINLLVPPTSTRHTPGPAAVVKAYLELDPSVLVIENYLWQNDPESALAPILEPIALTGTARPQGRPLIVCSVTDVVAASSRDSGNRLPPTATLSDCFDLVLVHSDPTFARLEEFLLPSPGLHRAVHHTGFVLAADTLSQRSGVASLQRRPRRIVVSAGDGPGAYALSRVAVQAQGLLWAASGLEMMVTLSGKLSAAQHVALRQAARGVPGLMLEASPGDRRHDTAGGCCIVCEGSFAALRDAMATGTPALVIPDPGADHIAQHERARRLVNIGGGRILSRPQLNVASLASSIQQLVELAPSTRPLQLNGAQVTAELIRERANRDVAQPH